MAESVQDSVWATGSRGRTARFPTAAARGQSSSITGSMYWHYIRQLLPIIFKFRNDYSMRAEDDFMHAWARGRRLFDLLLTLQLLLYNLWKARKIVEHSRIWIYYWSHEM
jgi:hypothetical protein